MALATNTSIDAVLEYDSVIFSSPYNTTISKGEINIFTVGTSATLEYRIETVDAAGSATGTLVTPGASATLTVVAGWNIFPNFASVVPVSGGVNYAAKVLWAAGSCATSRLANWASLDLPYQGVNTGTPAKAANIINVALASASGYIPIAGVWPVIAVSASTFVLGAALGDVRGVRFISPFTFRTNGLKLAQDNQVGTYSIYLTNDAGVTIAATSINPNPNNGLGRRTAYNCFQNPFVVTAGTTIRAFVRALTSTGSVNFYWGVPGTATNKSAMPGGVNWNYTFITSGSVSDTLASQYPMMDFLIDQLGTDTGGVSNKMFMRYDTNGGLAS